MHLKALKWTRSFTALLIGAALVTGCNNTEEGDITPPVLSVTPVDMSGPYNAADSTFGDIKMVNPVIIPFGEDIGHGVKSPAIEYFTIPNAPVRAVCRGRVEEIRANPVEQGDYEVAVIALPGSAYWIIYDHVLNVQFLEGQIVEPGDTIGVAGTWTDDMRRTELQINFNDDDEERSYCPLNYGDSAFNTAHNRLLNEYTLRSFTPSYDTLCLENYVIP